MRCSETLLTVTLAGLLIAPSARAEEAVVGKVGFIRGDVRLDGRPVRTTAPVKEGSVIRTDDGKATVFLGRDSVIHVDKKTHFKVTAHRTEQARTKSATLDLRFGKIRALVKKTKVPKAIRIRTRSAVMGVRGTHILVDAPEDPGEKPRFLTLEGEAEVMLSEKGLDAPDLAPTAAAAPKAGAAPTVVLKANQFFDANDTPADGGPVPIEIGDADAQDMADGVAPPPAILDTGDEFAFFEEDPDAIFFDDESAGEFFDDGPDGFPEDGFPEDFLDLDPTAPAGDIHLTVTFEK